MERNQQIKFKKKSIAAALPLIVMHYIIFLIKMNAFVLYFYHHES